MYTGDYGYGGTPPLNGGVSVGVHIRALNGVIKGYTGDYGHIHP